MKEKRTRVIEQLQRSNQDLKENLQMIKRTDYLEDQSRRNNLRFTGRQKFPDRPGKMKELCSILRDLLNLSPSFESVHRIGKPGDKQPVSSISRGTCADASIPPGSANMLISTTERTSFVTLRFPSKEAHKELHLRVNRRPKRRLQPRPPPLEYPLRLRPVPRPCVRQLRPPLTPVLPRGLTIMAIARLFVRRNR